MIPSLVAEGTKPNILKLVSKYVPTINFGAISLNFQLLGFIVAEILSLSKVDIYKGKGLLLANTNLVLKAGKQR